MSDPRRYQIGDHSVVAGLSWHAFADQKDFARTFASVAKKTYAAKFAVKRSGSGYFNAGFLPETRAAEIGDKKALARTVSLAAAIASELRATNCVCAVDIPGSSDMMLLEISSGSIDPEFGDLVGTEADIRAKFFQRATGYSGTDGIFAPARWNVTEAKDIGPIDAFYSRVLSKTNARKALLQPTVKTLPWIPIVACLVVVGAGATAWQMYESVKQQELASVRQAAAAVIAKKQAEELAAKATAVEMRPWFDKPVPRSIVAACGAVFADPKYESIKGWSLNDVECTSTRTRLKFGRTKSGVVAAMVSALPTAAVSVDGQNAVYTVDHPAKFDVTHEPAVATAEVVRAFVSAWQGIGVPITLQEVVPPAQNPPPKDPPPPLPYKTYKWAVVTKYRPATLLPVVEFPSARIDSFKVKFAEDGTAEFSIEGFVYGT
ncbi:MAG: type 4b pilus protein PilO2 [Betaproteobacteria bacterium]|jgi:hypothetical protein|nr:type 4b pilus protein PilO2 [Betaproteobacteria bacterium]